MYIAVLMIDSTIAAARSSILIVLFVIPASLSQKKNMDTCNNSKDGG
jgi:hypothetical protein